MMVSGEVIYNELPTCKSMLYKKVCKYFLVTINTEHLRTLFSSVHKRLTCLFYLEVGREMEQCKGFRELPSLS